VSAGGAYDLTLFRLPVSAGDAEPLPEQIRLANRPRGMDRRAAAKRAFWRALARDQRAPEHPSLGTLEDPVLHARLAALETGPGVFREPKRREIPIAVQEAIEERMPQFCLRNLVRYEMEAWVDDLWWETCHLRDTPRDVEADLAPARRGRMGPDRGELITELSPSRIRALKREHRQLMEVERWEDFSWRKGPRRAPDDPAPPEGG
jgi:hypothetical protein